MKNFIQHYYRCGAAGLFCATIGLQVNILIMAKNQENSDVSAAFAAQAIHDLDQ